jgi:phosphorylcholine metabolism protein LicD
MITHSLRLLGRMLGYPRLFFRIIYTSCALFVIGALIYNYYEIDSTIFIESFNESISIEQALEQIPTCTPNDRSRQRALLTMLQVWTHFAHKHHIRYWIGYGTLVGYVQRNGLLPHDEDIDISIMAQDTPQLIEFSQFNFSSSYELHIHPQWFIPDEKKRSYFSSEDIDFVAPNARFIDLEGDLHIDIWPIYDYNPSEKRFLKNSKPMLTEYDKYYNWKSSPKEWTFPLQECLFSGIKVWCPAEPQNLVTGIYGKISVNISSTKCVNGSWVRSSEYVFAKKKMKMEDISFTTKQTEYT